MATVKVLFVCMGNICRSPTAEGVFAKLLENEGLAHHVAIDSAGTHAYHEGNPPDQRSQRSAMNRGIDIRHLRARQVKTADFYEFDYVLAMDRDNLQNLESIRPRDAKSRPHLFLSYAPNLEYDEVPDPYYGGPNGFEQVLDMIEEASLGLLQDIRIRHIK